MQKEPRHTSPLTEDEIEALRERMAEWDRMEAYARLARFLFLSIAGAVIWIWGEDIRAMMKRIFG